MVEPKFKQEMLNPKHFIHAMSMYVIFTVPLVTVLRIISGGIPTIVKTAWAAITVWFVNVYIDSVFDVFTLQTSCSTCSEITGVAPVNCVATDQLAAIKCLANHKQNTSPFKTMIWAEIALVSLLYFFSNLFGGFIINTFFGMLLPVMIVTVVPFVFKVHSTIKMNPETREQLRTLMIDDCIRTKAPGSSCQYSCMPMRVFGGAEPHVQFSSLNPIFNDETAWLSNMCTYPEPDEIIQMDDSRLSTIWQSNTPTGEVAIFDDRACTVPTSFMWVMDPSSISVNGDENTTPKSVYGWNAIVYTIGPGGVVDAEVGDSFDGLPNYC